MARTLSHGKYCGLIPTRSVAESVFITHLLQDLQVKRLNLDATAEALHRAQGREIPNKTTQARAYHAPLAQLVTHQIEAHAPAAEGSALRALKAKSDDLERAQAKLQAHGHGLELTPRKDPKDRPQHHRRQLHSPNHILLSRTMFPTPGQPMPSSTHGSPRSTRPFKNRPRKSSASFRQVSVQSNNCARPALGMDSLCPNSTELPSRPFKTSSVSGLPSPVDLAPSLNDPW